jgi:hypothetical protein
MRYHQIVQVGGVLLPVETLYMKLVGRATFSLPYLVLLQDNSTTAYSQHFVLDTHLIDKLVLLLGILKFVFCNGRLHIVQKGRGLSESRWKGKGQRRDAIKRV